MSTLKIGLHQTTSKERLASKIKQELGTSYLSIELIYFEEKTDKNIQASDLENALINGNIDIAIQTFQNLTSSNALIIAAVSERYHPEHVLVLKQNAVDDSMLWNLRQNAQVFTNSNLVKAQLKEFRDDLKFHDLKVINPQFVEGEFDALVLSYEELESVQSLKQYKHVVLDPKTVVPEPAQGVLALQIREDDSKLYDALHVLNNVDTQSLIALERSIKQKIQLEDHASLGVYCPTEGHLYVAFSENWKHGAHLYEFEGPHDLAMADVVAETLLQNDVEDDEDIF